MSVFLNEILVTWNSEFREIFPDRIFKDRPNVDFFIGIFFFRQDESVVFVCYVWRKVGRVSC